MRLQDSDVLRQSGRPPATTSAQHLKGDFAARNQQIELLFCL